MERPGLNMPTQQIHARRPSLNMLVLDTQCAVRFRMWSLWNDLVDHLGSRRRRPIAQAFFRQGGCPDISVARHPWADSRRNERTCRCSTCEQRHKAHCVQPVTEGLRQTLVMELWEGPAGLLMIQIIQACSGTCPGVEVRRGGAPLAPRQVECRPMPARSHPFLFDMLSLCFKSSMSISPGCNHRCHQRSGPCEGFEGLPLLLARGQWPFRFIACVRRWGRGELEGRPRPHPIALIWRSSGWILEFELLGFLLNGIGEKFSC